MSNNAHELSNRLLNALDSNYNVVDMQTVNEIISILENFNITKELLETTRLGKHVNELRRQTKDATLARRAKVLVKRWRDLVIPPANAHPGSNRSSAERQVRRLGGTPLTSPALQRQVVSPVVPSPRSSSRPAWGYESDSQDVIVVVDDDPPEQAPLMSQTLKRPLSVEPIPVDDDKKAKRDKKPKKRRGHSRAGSGSDTATSGAGWTGRNGTERRRNGCRRELVDPYAALVQKMPTPGAKKVKTTQELLEEIQSRGSKPATSPCNPDSPDVLLIEDPIPTVKVESPLRNGDAEVKPLTPRPSTPLPPLEDDRPVRECTCDEDIEDPECPAAWQPLVLPIHIHALHHTYLPGINGTRAPLHPHQFAVRKIIDPENPEIFNSIVPLYKYSDYADDQCVKNMSRVPICPNLSVYQFAPDPPELPPPKTPPPLLPYPLDSFEAPSEEIKEEEERLAVESIKCEADSRSVSPTILTGVTDLEEVVGEVKCSKIGPEMVSLPFFQPSVKLKGPQLFEEDENIADIFKCPKTDVTPKPIENERLKAPVKVGIEDSVKCEIESNIEKMDIEEQFRTEIEEHRTVERTKREEIDLDGRTLYEMCVKANDSVPYNYSQTSTAPVVTLPLDDDSEVVSEVLESAMRGAEEATLRDPLGRPNRPPNFAEWHECAKLGDLIALPYVVID